MIKLKGITAFLMIALVLTGCGKKQTANTNEPGTSTKAQVVQPQMKLVKKQNKVPYILTNGIEVRDDNRSFKTPKGTVAFNFPQISGLANRSVEAKINKDIIEDIKKGLTEYIPETGAKPSELQYSLHYNVEVNANNILTISISQYYSPPAFGVLYRLTDGKRLSLKEIFTEGTDYISLVNQKVIGQLMKEEKASYGDAESDEEFQLGRAFTTIKPDQSFILSLSKLYIVFKPGEGDFDKRSTIAVPLNEIDDYVNVMDVYTGIERKTHLKQELIVRNNNIFTIEKGEVKKRKNGNVWVKYFQVSGLRDDAFEATINKKIMDLVNEAVNSKSLDNIKMNKDQYKDRLAEIEVMPIFNSYGILTISRNVYYEGDADLDSLETTYSFDLIRKKSTDVKNILKNYLKKSSLEDRFAEMVKEDLKKQLRKQNDDFINDVNAKVDYTFILNNANVQIYSNGRNLDGIEIGVYFGKGIFKSMPDGVRSYIKLKDILRVTPEEFFAG